jgi:hypothetical protein
MEKPDQQFSQELMDAIAYINSKLTLLSNKEAREALTMVASVRNLRLVSMDRPIGRPIDQLPRPTKVGKPARAGGGCTGLSARTPPTWKLNPDWIASNKKHSELVSKIKGSSDSKEKESLIKELREIEVGMKLYKRKLVGFRLPLEP